MTELPKIINKAELARRMGIAPAQLNNKLKGAQRNKFTDDDKRKAVEVLQEAIKEIDATH